MIVRDNNVKLIDLVLAEKHIIEVKQTLPFKVYTLRDEIKLSFNTGFKDSFALFKQLPELLTDFKQAFINHEERIRFDVIKDSTVLLHRKIVTLGPSQTFLIYVKCDVSRQIKVVLSEQ